MIKVLVVDDHEMVRLGVTSYLMVQPDIEVIAEAENGLQGYHKALEYKPDVILMDLVMDVMDGIEATKKIISEWPEAKIIIVTSFLDDEKVFPAIESGASGYLLKTSSANEIAQAIRDTYAGNQVIEKEVTDKLLDKQYQDSLPKLHDELTSRELEVLLLIGKGYSNQEIADELFITLKTVKTHVSNILSKLEVEDRTQATIYAFKHNLIEP
ncbi:response regulator transcription factor [Aerococcaceae bacterium zg-ZUI334]|uniref:response regulator transcription factor n=1 Tax=Aerococcaceae TaxID=186827 RepID=UPI0013B83728|nr:MULTISPECIES: response regulator transcription factor [unclassified Facklamia]MBR7927027.1 response regulator transcription factor [Aerococcaceae bacterium zg-ZUI334]MBS4461878.1 response regulator transcription factor [Aerococcaceae bacterium zg-B36]QQD66395.1 response regulator transcription factor [Aerococcaceae bacterium zg-252]NEW63588.1 response regulator [Facklamia sp. 252]NEW67059.1 response regulator [Facklamia sp. 253]